MQFEKFTDRTRKIVDLASQEAAQLGDASVNTVHLLVGMLREGKGVASNVLAQNDIDVDSVLDAYKSIDNEADTTLENVESSCLVEAKWFGHNYVGTEHSTLGSLQSHRLQGGHRPEDGDFGADVLSLEEEVRWLRRRGAAAPEATRRRES